MENIQSITSYTDVLGISMKSQLPLFLLLELGNYPSLMTEVIQSLAVKNPHQFKLIQLHGSAAKAIQSELNILNLPALVIMKKDSIQAIYQGLIAEHEIHSILSKIN